MKETKVKNGKKKKEIAFISFDEAKRSTYLSGIANSKKKKKASDDKKKAKKLKKPPKTPEMIEKTETLKTIMKQISDEVEDKTGLQTIEFKGASVTIEEF